MISGLVLPDIEASETAPFWAAARDHRLVVQSCSHCGQKRFYPQPYCASCCHPEAEWVEVSGRGRIWSYVIAHAPTLPAYEPFTPFPIAIIALEEDAHLRMAGNLVSDATAPINSVTVTALEIGLKVRAVFQEVAPNIVLPRWQPVFKETP